MVVIVSYLFGSILTFILSRKSYISIAMWKEKYRRFTQIGYAELLSIDSVALSVWELVAKNAYDCIKTAVLTAGVVGSSQLWLNSYHPQPNALSIRDLPD
jgi:uncharacterized membrane protein